MQRRIDRRREKVAEAEATTLYALLCLAAVACFPGERASAPPCPNRFGAGEHSLSFVHEGVRRHYLLHLPEKRPAGKRLPLLLAFHGLGGSAREQMEDSGFNALSDRHRFAVAYPEGIANADGGQAWNGGLCCAFGQPDRDDVSFVRKLVRNISDRTCIDPKRVYAAGSSNGGHLSYRLACEASDLVAAVGSVVGVLLIPTARCRPSRPVPVLHIHGTADAIVPYRGGRTIRELDYPSVPEVLAFFRRLNGCDDPERVWLSAGPVRCSSPGRCRGGGEVAHCRVEGMGHCWPGAPGCSDGAPLQASQVLWEFFSRHRLP